MGPRIAGVAFLLGVGVIAAGAVLAGPTLIRVGRPLLRAGLKRGLEVYASARTRMEEAAEDVGDLFAEVQDEVLRSRNVTPHAAKAESERAEHSERARA